MLITQPGETAEGDSGGYDLAARQDGADRRRRPHARQERGQGRPAGRRPQHRRVGGDAWTSRRGRRRRDQRVRALFVPEPKPRTMSVAADTAAAQPRRPRAAALAAGPSPRAAPWLAARAAGQALWRPHGAARRVAATLHRGEAVGLLGPNGAGKTTCFYIITGLLAADGGQVLLDGQDITALPMYRRARLGIGYLPQEASIFRGLNVEDNIRAVLEIAAARPRTVARTGSSGCSPSSASRICAAPRRWRCRAASGDGSRSPGHWRPIPASSCSTSRWPGSTRSTSARSASWSATSRIAASAC